MDLLPRSVPTIAQLVERLFKVYRDPQGNEYTVRYVALAADGDVGPTTIHNLRTGVIPDPNPSHRTMQALSLFFGVEPNYFFPELWDQFAPHYWQVWEQYRSEHPDLFP